MSERTGTERTGTARASTGTDPGTGTSASSGTSASTGGGTATGVTVVEPLRTNDRTTVLVGCTGWAVLLVLGLLNLPTLEAEGRGWWVWTCVAGLVLGVVGLAWLQVRHRRLVASGRTPSRSPTG